MRKTTKGAIAVGAGVALLLGGAGTMAAWSVSKNLSDQSGVTAGNLDLTLNTAGAKWYWGLTTINTTTNAVTCSGPDTNNQITGGIATVKLVPGDCVVYVTPATVVASGNHLTANLAVTGTVTTTDTVPASPLAASLDVSSTVSIPTATTGLSLTDSKTIKVDSTAGAINAVDKVNVAVKVIFKGETANQVGTNGAVTLTGAAVTFKQSAPAVAP